MDSIDLTDRKAFKELLKDSGNYESLTASKIISQQISAGAGLTFNFAASGVSATVLELLESLGREAQLSARYKSLLSGEIANPGEGRRVLHHYLRGIADPSLSGAKELESFYKEQKERALSFAQKVRSGEITSPSGKKYTDVVQIGIGGSDLGPKALSIALAEVSEPQLVPHFLSNVDPWDAVSVLKGIPLETTLFVLVSKSGGTLETLTNGAFAASFLGDSEKAKAQMVVVTSKTSPLAKDSGYLDHFYMDDFIGGRYSATSCVGALIMSLAYGPEVFSELLDGAHEADVLSLEPDPSKNAAMMSALIGVYFRNVKNYSTSAVLPYSQALSRFSAHLQQLDMESNGKHVRRDASGQIAYETGPIIWGEPGTNGQHSFYQSLHQGTTIVPLQFIGFAQASCKDFSYNGSTSHQKLNANLVAQIVAFSRGENAENLNKEFKGSRPSTLIYGDKLTARSLGALLAHYENKVMFQGFLWNINSFDQEGVQLGKKLAVAVLDKKDDDLLTAYAKILKIFG